MWSSVDERITDGTSGLEPQSQPAVLFLGTSSRGAVDTPLAIGRRSALADIIGFGSLAQILADCQKNMADASILAVRTEADREGSFGPVRKSEDAGELILLGSPLFGCRVELEILNGEELAVRWEGAKHLNERLPLPQNGELSLKDLGVRVHLPESLKAGQKWSFDCSAPLSSLEALKRGLSRAMDIYTPEAVVVCQASGAEDAAFWGAEAETYFEAEHKPVHVILYTELEDPSSSAASMASAVSLSYEQLIAAKVKEFSKTDARFVSVLCQPGQIIDGSFKYKRQPLGFLAASLTKSAVNQSIGATRWFAVPHFAFPEGWGNVHSRALDEGRFITLRTYAGLNGIFWSNGRTLAAETSDYRFMEIVRTVHKAVRLARHAVLPCIHAPGDEKGVKDILARIRSALTGMTESSPVELLGFELDAPAGQDIVNKGLMVDISLYGVPIVRKMVLNFMYKYPQGDAL